MKNIAFLTSDAAKARHWRTSSVLLLLASLTAGCAASQKLTPEPSVELANLTVSQAQNSPLTAPQTVRWGGTIIGVTNTADNKTHVEIVSRPLLKTGRPINDDSSDGRFVAEFDEFLDPQIYTAGRELSVIGTVNDILEGSIGDMSYSFPRLVVSDFRYWAVRPQHRDHPHSTFHNHRYHNDPFWHDRYYRGGVFGRFILHP